MFLYETKKIHPQPSRLQTHTALLRYDDLNLYMIVVFSANMFESAEIVGVVDPKWRFNPSYMHSFGKYII